MTHATLRDPGDLDLDRTTMYRIISQIQYVLFVEEYGSPMKEWDAETVDEVAKVLAEHGLAPDDYE